MFAGVGQNGSCLLCEEYRDGFKDVVSGAKIVVQEWSIVGVCRGINVAPGP